MRYTSTINNLKCVEWELTLSQAFLLDILIISDLWAKRETVDGVDYRWVSRNKILDEIPHAYKTADTVYRALKDLADKGIINYQKLGKKDLIRFTDKGKEWVFCQTGFDSKLGNKSESSSNSEINPNELGNNPENNSDSNPTDNGTKLYNGTKENIYISENEKNDDVISVMNKNAQSISDWQAPSKEVMQAELVRAGSILQMTDDQYQIYVDDFKGHFEQNALTGKPLLGDRNRKNRLRQWLENIAKKQSKQSNVFQGNTNANTQPANNQHQQYDTSTTAGYAAKLDADAERYYAEQAARAQQSANGSTENAF